VARPGMPEEGRPIPPDPPDPPTGGRERGGPPPRTPPTPPPGGRGGGGPPPRTPPPRHPAAAGDAALPTGPPTPPLGGPPTLPPRSRWEDALALSFAPTTSRFGARRNSGPSQKSSDCTDLADCKSRIHFDDLTLGRPNIRPCLPTSFPVSLGINSTASRCAARGSDGVDPGVHAGP